MARWSIRRMMLVIAGAAVLLGGYIWWERLPRGCYPSCQSNLRYVVLGLYGYALREGRFPSGTLPNASLPPERRMSLYAAALPDLDLEELWVQLHTDQAWDDKSNERIVNTRIGVFRCPDRDQSPVGTPMPTPYIGIAGLGTDAPFLPKGHPRTGIFGYDRQTALKDITDGQGYTMLVVESGRVRGSWLAGGPATVRGLDTADLPYLGLGRQFGGLHSISGAQVAFADGSVRFIEGTINPKVFEALSTIAGGERLPDDLFR
jgi:prepilin-type processing-associated H-X9-DG protein